MLKAWADTGGVPRDPRARRSTRAAGQLIEVVKIQAFELAAEGQTVDPYVIVTDGDRQVLRTRYAAAVREAEWTGFKATDAGVDQPRAFGDGQPLFFEIWDDNYLGRHVRRRVRRVPGRPGRRAGRRTASGWPSTRPGSSGTGRSRSRSPARATRGSGSGSRGARRPRRRGWSDETSHGSVGGWRRRPGPPDRRLRRVRIGPGGPRTSGSGCTGGRAEQVPEKLAPAPAASR